MAIRYVVLSAENLVVNIVMWDGVSPYNPGDGLRLVPVADDLFIDVGWTWTPTGPQPPAEVDGE